MRVETGLRQIDFGEDLTLTELVQRLPGKLLQCFTQQNESDVAVFGVCAWGGSERDLKRLTQQIVFTMGGLEQLDIGRQAGRVGQKHAERDSPAGLFLL